VPEPAPSPPATRPAATYVPPWTLDHLLPTALALVVGLGWGALMLIVLGFWMRSKNEAGLRILSNVFLIGGAVSAGLAVWQAFTLWFKLEAPEQKTATLGMQRRILGNLLLVAGLALIGLSFYLGIGKKTGGDVGFLLSNLAESIGVLLFGIIALGGGYLLTLPPQSDDDSPMRALVGKTPMLKLLTAIIGAVAFIGFCVLTYRFRDRSGYMAWIPELGALLFLSVLCFSCVLWLNTGEFDDVRIRVFVLVFGGSFGLILFLYALARAYIWRSDVLLGGMAAWQGPNGWHGWLVIYLQIIALILMFVSFNLARTDIRANVTLRRVMYGYDTLLQGLLLFEFLCVFNVVIGTMFLVNYDWTATRGVHALAPSSKNLISGLKKEINVVVLMRQGNPVYKDLHNLLDNCAALNSTKFKVTYLSPESNFAQFEQLSKTFPKISPEVGTFVPGVLLISGPIPDKEDEKIAYSFVPDRKISEQERPRGIGEKGKMIFKGEGEILKEVKFLAQDKKKHRVYLLQGDDEPDINNKDDRDRVAMNETFANVGLGVLADRLELDNYEVIGLNFGKDLGLKAPKVEFVKEGADKKKSIPPDCGTLIVAGASAKLPQEALDAIEAYMDRGGKMLVFLDVFAEPDYSKLKNSGMEALVNKFGVKVDNDFALRFPIRGDDARDLIAFPARKTDNPLAREFSRPIIMRRSARVVRAAPPGRYRAETIFQLDLVPRQFLYTVEKKANALSNPQKHMIALRDDEAKGQAALSREAIPVAVAVSEVGQKDNDRPCLVVFGDTEFITNRDIERWPTNYALVVSSIEWMSERESIGAQPKVSPQFQLPPGVNWTRMMFLPGWIMLLSLIGLGVAVWIVRRR
jgi:hypothetical protein